MPCGEETKKKKKTNDHRGGLDAEVSRDEKQRDTERQEAAHVASSSSSSNWEGTSSDLASPACPVQALVRRRKKSSPSRLLPRMKGKLRVR